MDKVVGIVAREEKQAHRSRCEYIARGFEFILRPDQPGMAKFDRVVIALHDGSARDSGPIRHPRGHAASPMSDAELGAKFLDCAAHGEAADAEALLARLQDLDRAAGVRELAA